MKKYGRAKINRLDVILAIACVLFSLVSLFISICVTLVDKAPIDVYNFSDLIKGLTFDFNVKNLQIPDYVAIADAVLVYGSLFALVMGSIFFSKRKQLKERAIALFGGFIACVGIAVSGSLAYQFLEGAGKDIVSVVWPYTIFALDVVLLVIGLNCFVFAFNRNLNMDLKAKLNDKPEYDFKKGLDLDEFVLLVETILILVVGVLVLVFGNTQLATAKENMFVSMQYALFCVTFSAVNLGGFSLSASGIVLAIFAYINLIILIALIIRIAKSKNGGHLVTLFGYLIGFILALFAGAFFLKIARPILGHISTFKRILVVALLIASFLIYVLALYCAISALVRTMAEEAVAKDAERRAQIKAQDDEELKQLDEEIDLLEKRIEVLEAAILNGQVVAAPAAVEEEPEEESQPEEEPEEEPELEEEPEDDNPFANLKRKKTVPFETKLKKAKKEVKERYKMIVAALREYEFNDRKSIPGETFSYKRNKLVFITFSGASLKVHFKLDPKDFVDSPIPMKDASEVKKYEEVPAFLMVKSDLAARRVIKLATELAEANSVPKK